MKRVFTDELRVVKDVIDKNFEESKEANDATNKEIIKVGVQID